MGERDVQREWIIISHVLCFFLIADIFPHGCWLVGHAVGMHGSSRMEWVLVGAHSQHLVSAGGEDVDDAGVEGRNQRVGRGCGASGDGKQTSSPLVPSAQSVGDLGLVSKDAPCRTEF